MKIIALLISALLLVGCTTVPLTPAGAKVVITVNQNLDKDCRRIDIIKADDELGGWGVSGDQAENSARNALRNKAAKMGGDTVLLMSSKTWYAHSWQEGEVYDCSKNQEPPPAK